ncbi:hypothetical protein W02_41720 [Nitrospira sp. KM1]|uniref:PilZ domain-containing protein n=1 Tax=Nitrospira sp. KM1 TaxID=1936990 RepID=UPI0013A756CF|nr:PilZ domain-containing protein [Nitrospira sp. KM1]BCA57032.1 hypothetical protein W02_41720 [Nitrospira sp. KM1]
MPPRTPVFILIINENAEETKLATISLRGFFPDCRIDAAYSAEEARTLMSARIDWSIILLDGGCLSEHDPGLISDLKLHAQQAALILQSHKTDAQSAIHALQAGIDFYLAKQSPAFLTELLFCAREALDKRDLHLAVEHATIRHRQLLESLPDVSYELDADGFFISLGPGVTSLLGYRIDELLGMSYTRLCPPNSQPHAKFRFNERRSGTRSARQFRLILQHKPDVSGAVFPIIVEISARGLYDSHRRFIGTVGVIRDLSDRPRQPTMEVQDQPQMFQERDPSIRHQEQAPISLSLETSLSSLRTHLQELLSSLHEVRLQERIEQLASHIDALSDLSNRLLHPIEPPVGLGSGLSIRDLIVDLIASDTSRTLEGISVAEFSGLPAFHGDKDKTVGVMRDALLYALAYVQMAGRNRALSIEFDSHASSPDSGQRVDEQPQPPLREIDIIVTESEQNALPEFPQAIDVPTDLLRLFGLVKEIRGTLAMSASSTGPFRLVIRLPTGHGASLAQPQVIQAAPLAPKSANQPPVPLPSSVHASERQPVPIEKRRWPRTATSLPAHAIIDAASWDGLVVNIGQGGACLTLPADCPAIVNQDVYVILRTVAGILELNGSANIRPSSGLKQQGLQHTALVIAFDPLRPAEAAILSSLVAAAKDRSVALSLDMLLATDTEIPPQSPPAVSEAPQDEERRESVRVQLALPVRIEASGYQEPGNRLVAHICDISRDGAGVIAKIDPLQLSGRVILHFPPAQTGNVSGSHEPGAPDSALPAYIVRTTVDPTALQEPYPPDPSHTARIGVRFVSLTPFAERELARLIKQHLASPPPDHYAADRDAVISVYRECRNHRGQIIAMTDDHPAKPLAAETPIIVIAPGFGQTSSDYSALSYYLASHRLRVLRYDHTNHAGRSDGELQNTTLRSMQTDLGKVLEFAAHTWPTAPIALLANDLGARVALKLAAHIRPLELIILNNPIVDVGALLMAVHGHDLVADHRYGLRRGITNLFGLNINVDQFVGDVIAGRLTDLSSTLEDLRLLQSPLKMILSPMDTPSLPPPDLPHGFLSVLSPHTSITTVPTTLVDHGRPSPEVEPAAFKQIMEHLAAGLKLKIQTTSVAETAHELARHQRVAMEQTRLHHGTSQASRHALAIRLGQHVAQLTNVHEYRKLLDDLYAFLGSLASGTVVVDVGIGQSDLSRAVLINHTYRVRQRGPVQPPLPSLVGVRRLSETLTHARRNVLALQQELNAGLSEGGSAPPALRLRWVQGEWDQPLPFRSHSVHRIISNLSLPFAASTRVTLSEWARVLRPDGRLVFTTFHPRTDLSHVYRHHLRLGNQDEFSAQAQPVLHLLGRLREAIKHGILNTFEQHVLSSLLRQSGHHSFRISHVLGGQAFMVVVGKGISTSSPA